MTTPRIILALLVLTGWATAPVPPTMQRLVMPELSAGEPVTAPPTITTIFYGSSNDAVLGYVERWHTVKVTGTNQATIVFEDSPTLTPPAWMPVIQMQYVSGQVNQVIQPITNNAPQGFERARLVTP